MAGAGWSRILAAAAVAALLVLQRLAGVHATGGVRLVLGLVLSLALCAAVAALARPARGPRFAKPPIKPARVYMILTPLALAGVFAREAAPCMALPPRGAPVVSVIVVLGFWLVILARLFRKGGSPRLMLVALMGLTAGTSWMTMGAQPFDRLDGDMLAAIDRSLDELLAGRFPYVNHPPPMPYPPLTFLAYLPPKLLGLDLRWTNLVLVVATVGATFLLPRRLADRNGPTASAAGDSPPLLLNQLLLPCLMLHPVWVQHGANGQYAPSLFFTMLLGFAVLFENPRAQAVALGLAVGSNQMLAACGPILFGHWLGRFGARRAAGLALMAAAVVLLIISPFLLWEPNRFIETAFLSRGRFDDATMAGRFSLLPPASRFLPRADLVGAVAAITAAAWVAFRRRSAGATVAAMASGLCVALMFQPVSFAHYFLPAIVLAAVVPDAPTPAPAYGFSPSCPPHYNKPVMTRVRRIPGRGPGADATERGAT